MNTKLVFFFVFFFCEGITSQKKVKSHCPTELRMSQNYISRESGDFFVKWPRAAATTAQLALCKTKGKAPKVVLLAWFIIYMNWQYD